MLTCLFLCGETTCSVFVGARSITSIPGTWLPVFLLTLGVAVMMCLVECLVMWHTVQNMRRAYDWQATLRGVYSEIDVRPTPTSMEEGRETIDRSSLTHINGVWETALPMLK